MDRWNAEILRSFQQTMQGCSEISSAKGDNNLYLRKLNLKFKVLRGLIGSPTSPSVIIISRFKKTTKLWSKLNMLFESEERNQTLTCVLLQQSSSTNQTRTVPIQISQNHMWKFQIKEFKVLIWQFYFLSKIWFPWKVCVHIVNIL